MSIRPEDLARRVGQDVTTRGLVREALRCLRVRLGGSLAALLLVAALWVLMHMAGVLLAMSAAAPALSATPSPRILWFVRLPPLLSVTLPPLLFVGPWAAAVRALLMLPMLAGLRWRIATAYEGRGVRAGDIWEAFRLCYRPVAVLGLMQVGCEIALIIGLIAIGTAADSAGWAADLATAVFAATAVGLLRLFLFLATFYPFADPTITVRRCLANNWRVLRERPRQFLAAYFVPLGLYAAVAVAGGGFFTGGLALVSGGATWLGAGVLMATGVAVAAGVVGVMLFGMFLRAAVFRASYGMALWRSEPAAEHPSFSGSHAF